MESTTGGSDQGLAHTGEHIFMRGLQDRLPSLKVLRVEIGPINRVHLQAEDLTWELVLEAEKIANRIIREDRRITEHRFESLEEAAKSFPSLRAREERISGMVRVIEVEDYDYSACSGTHASHTGSVRFFLVTDLNRSGETYALEFEVAEKAIETALTHSYRLQRVSAQTGAPMSTLDRALTNLIGDFKDLRSRLQAISESVVEAIQPLEIGGVRLYSAQFQHLDNRALMDSAGRLIRNSGTIVLLGNGLKDGFAILARSGDLNLDCAEILKEGLSKFGGKGGGRADFASGSLPVDSLDGLFVQLRSRIEPLLRDQ